MTTLAKVIETVIFFFGAGIGTALWKLANLLNYHLLGSILLSLCGFWSCIVVLITLIYQHHAEIKNHESK